MLSFPPSSAQKQMLLRVFVIVGLEVVLTLAALWGLYAWLEKAHRVESAWMREPDPVRGVALEADLDPDGDGLDPFLDGDADGDGVSNAEDVVRYANTLVGRPSDPLMGMYGNLLGRIGFVVCVDIAVESYLAAGLSLPALLRQSALAHPSWFSLSPDNLPVDPNFIRRVRNYRDLFAHHPDLILDAQPDSGDIAFFGRSHLAVVTGTGGEGYRVVEAYAARAASNDGSAIEGRMGLSAVFGRIRSPGQKAQGVQSP